MRNIDMNLKTVVSASAVVLALGFQATAQAASVSTTGTFDDVQPSGGSGVFDLTGEGTSQIEWGAPGNSGDGVSKSGYLFEGVSGENVNLPTGFGNMSNVFDLGYFTHFNFPILGNPPGPAAGSITGATLNIATSFVPPAANQPLDFSFGLSHNETPNNGGSNGICEEGGNIPCPDVVSFLNNGESNNFVNIDGQEYRLTITGFLLDDGTVVQDFLTLEGEANTATLQGKLTAVPEPLTILGAGAAVSFGGYFKRKLSKKSDKKA